MDFGGFGAGRIAVGARALPTTTGGRRGSSADARKGSKGKGIKHLKVLASMAIKHLKAINLITVS
jgi:hypothetical protein